MKPLLLLSLAFGLAVSAAAKEGDMIGFINVNDECKLDGPKVENKRVNECWRDARQADQEMKVINGTKLTAQEKPAYCFCGKMIAWAEWTAPLRKEVKGGMKYSYSNTQKFEKIAKLYGQIFADALCRDTGVPAGEEQLAKIREDYLDMAKTYMSRTPADKAGSVSYDLLHIDVDPSCSKELMAEKSTLRASLEGATAKN